MLPICLTGDIPDEKIDSRGCEAALTLSIAGDPLILQVRYSRWGVEASNVRIIGSANFRKYIT